MIACLNALFFATWSLRMSYQALDVKGTGNLFHNKFATIPNLTTFATPGD
jgi:hypothetical protein